ncbi:hypothetical protein K1719_008986 [Acacia pycnantha]|nr:hypothetical protein K1719_008986 [Acacia pycnantha]
MSCKNKSKKLMGLSDDEEEEKWLKYYSSHHQILLVGEGDFSFALCLAQSFGSASNIVASSLDTHDEVVRKYKKAKSNLVGLTKLGADVLHGVDATQMKSHPDLNMSRFDRIIFNFPHAGFHGREDDFFMIATHRDLIRRFFKNASSMLSSNGEVHINHKITPPYDYWCIEELGIQNFLLPIECVEFKKEDYPGYTNKRGDGSRCDQPFPLGKCSTFKFVLLTKKQSNPRNQRILSNHHYPLRSLSPHSPPSVIICRNGHLPIFGEGGYFNSEKGILGRAGSGYVDRTSGLLQRSFLPESTLFRHPETEYARNLVWKFGKHVPGYVHGMSSDFQRLSWPEPTEFRYSEIERSRNMVRMFGKHFSGYVHGMSPDLQIGSWPESRNVMYLGTDTVRDHEYVTLRPYHAASWF